MAIAKEIEFAADPRGEKDKLEGLKDELDHLDKDLDRPTVQATSNRQH
jgi:hypothetical protein